MRYASQQLVKALALGSENEIISAIGTFEFFVRYLDVAVSQLSFSRIFGDLFRQTFLFFNYFLPYFLHNRKQNRGYDTATQEERKRKELKEFL
jgi:hypothetical protein